MEKRNRRLVNVLPQPQLQSSLSLRVLPVRLGGLDRIHVLRPATGCHLRLPTSSSWEDIQQKVPVDGLMSFRLEHSSPRARAFRSSFISDAGAALPRAATGPPLLKESERHHSMECRALVTFGAT